MQRLILVASLAFITSSDVVHAQGPTPDKDGWYYLFDGKTLDGWKAADEPKAFKVENGLIVAGGTKLTHLYYVGPILNAKFKNFELKAEVKTRPKGNSGIIFHTEFQAKGFPDRGFEFQINNTGSDKVFRTGSIYPAKKLDRVVVKDDEWFECHLVVKGNKVVLKVNGEVTMDTTLPHEAKAGRTLANGTFAIQGHDPGSIVYFRSIRVKPFAGDTETDDKAKQGHHSGLDLYGDPLPPGALRRLGTVRFRQEYVHDMAFTPDGESLVVESPGRLVQWELATGKPLRTIPTSQSGNYRSLGLSRDGRLVAVRPDNNSVVVMDLATGKEQFRKNVAKQYPGGVISPDNSRIAIGATNGSSLWNLHTGEQLAELRGTEDLKFSPDSTWLAGRFREPREEQIILFNAKTGQEHTKVRPIFTKKLEDERISGFGFTPDGQTLLASWWYAGILIYDLKNQKVVHHLDIDAKLVAISPDSKIMVATKDRTVMMTSIETGKEIRRWQVNDNFLAGAYGAFSPDGKTLALGFECGIQLWDPVTGKRLDSFRGPVHIPQYLAVSDDAKTIAVLYGRHAGQFLQLFDTETLQEKARIDAKPFTLQNLAFSPNGRRLAFNDQSQIRIMDVEADREIKPGKKILGLFSHWKGSDSVVVVDHANPRDQQAHWIAVNAATGEERYRTPIPRDFGMQLYAPSFSNERRRMIVVSDRNGAGGDDGRMFLAEAPSGQRIRPLVFPKIDKNDRFWTKDVRGFSPDERLILIGERGQGLITFSEAASGRERFQIKPDNPLEFLSATFSPDGRLIVVSREGSHTILDSLTFEPLMEFVPMTFYGSSYAFSANGKIMVTGDTSSLLVWDLKTALRTRITSPDKLNAAQLRALWTELENVDARIGHRAMITLSRRPDEAIAFLKSLLPTSTPDAAAFKRLVRELDDPNFKTREAAQNAIIKMGESAGTMIRQSLQDSPSLELRRRLEALADNLKFSDGDRVRWIRCVELLERIGTPPARAALEAIRNASDPETSADATRSLERLAILTK